MAIQPNTHFIFFIIPCLLHAARKQAAGSMVNTIAMLNTMANTLRFMFFPPKSFFRIGFLLQNLIPQIAAPGITVKCFRLHYNTFHQRRK